MTIETQKPLPCPFCGGEKVSIQEGSTYRWAHAACGECGAAAGDIRRQYGQEVDDPEVIAKAIAEWNTRAAPIQVEVPRELTDDERTFAEALESALTEHADVWQALADLDAGKERK